jgi:hypothetical protein
MGAKRERLRKIMFSTNPAEMFHRSGIPGTFVEYWRQNDRPRWGRSILFESLRQGSLSIALKCRE